MEDEEIFVGGEFCYDGLWQTSQPAVDTSHLTFLSGGKACLIVIADFLKQNGISRILLPSYLCPTIVSTLERCGLSCAYYRVGRDLAIDLEDLAAKAGTFRAVYFINYFGFPQPPAVRRYLKKLQSRQILIVEDNTQSGFWEDSLGDFVFNSMRKVCPYDGGYLQSGYDLRAYAERRTAPPSHRLGLIRRYRAGLRQYQQGATDNFTELVRLFAEAERAYDAEMNVPGDPLEKYAIEHLDWPAIRAARRQNYGFLLELTKPIQGLEPIFSTLPEEVTPLGLPVYISGKRRDKLNNRLGEAGIGLTIHWEDLLTDARLNGEPTAAGIAADILTLTVDQSTTPRQLRYLARKLAEFLPGKV